MPTRSEALLDAAIRAVGTNGLRALTHRAVDAAAGLPTGSASNLFRTREALLRAMVVRMIDTEVAGWDRLAGAASPTTPEALAGTLGTMVETLTGPLRTLTVARYTLFMEAARDESLQAEMGRGARRVAAIGREWLAAAGSRDPDTHTALVMAHLDGLVLHRLAFPGTPPGSDDAAAGLTTLLRALVPTGA
ncbi:transcriptional regulator, TetR family [Promicromonospora umidemergens]|uniref:TetR/AcrR family transcriptional regulator n=1 Tax=Promicromonospora umidemergens TaxID=629679 RepID=A0ABP8XNR9_9MICO|nr:TetR family transcriptional regulator [Promicromonospora umidemergens]MCP2281908.1 transcriptional regulator, TetR family [Promicromonospora umidemergens]